MYDYSRWRILGRTTSSTSNSPPSIQDEPTWDKLCLCRVLQHPWKGLELLSWTTQITIDIKERKKPTTIWENILIFWIASWSFMMLNVRRTCLLSGIRWWIERGIVNRSSPFFRRRYPRKPLILDRYSCVLLACLMDFPSRTSSWVEMTTALTLTLALFPNCDSIKSYLSGSNNLSKWRPRRYPGLHYSKLHYNGIGNGLTILETHKICSSQAFLPNNWDEGRGQLGGGIWLCSVSSLVVIIMLLSSFMPPSICLPYVCPPSRRACQGGPLLALVYATVVQQPVESCYHWQSGNTDFCPQPESGGWQDYCDHGASCNKSSHCIETPPSIIRGLEQL